MPSFMGIRSRPATSGSGNGSGTGTGSGGGGGGGNADESGSHRRHSSILAEKPKVQDHHGHRSHKPKRSLHRLSLSFGSPAESTFGALFTRDPEEIPTYRKSEEQRRESMDQVFEDETPTDETKGIPPDAPALSTKESNFERRERPIKPERFSLLKFRHASDPQLSSRYKDSRQAASVPLPMPKIITTAPTSHQLDEPIKKKPKKATFGRSLSPFRKSAVIKEHEGETVGVQPDTVKLEGILSTPNLGKQTKIQFDPFLSREHQSVMQGPPAYGDESGSALAIPVSRLSESGGSEGSSGDHKLYARTTTTISTTTTFFRLKKKKRERGPLFPLPERFAPPVSGRNSTSAIGEGSRRSMSPGRRSNQAVRFGDEDGGDLSHSPSPTHSLTALTNAPFGLPGPTIVRKQSTLSAHSGASTPSLVPPRLGARGRSSTMGSISKASDRDGDATPQATASSRTSTSTSGRRSFGDLLLFSHRTRQNSAPPRHGSLNSPTTPGSKSNSMQINREAEPEVCYPARDESDTPATYLEKLEAAVQRGSLATILCKHDDDFSKTCLRKYMRGFSYFGESIDMAVRKMLMEVELPKETQQIDRLLGGFADRYHECNPGIFVNADEASIIAFSILLLHSDNHNKNNKRKMQKQDYVKNTQHSRISISADVLECFYDNICYTPFIHFDDEVAINSHRLTAVRPRKNLIRSKSSETVLRGQIDPYTLILDQKLDLLRPPLKDIIPTEDTYNSSGTLKALNFNDYHYAFLKSSVLQIVSARSRPDAFATQATISNPFEAQAGLVSIKVAKVGLLWRKDMKKKKAKRPWQEWGAILTDSKLYFFKDVGWVKRLMNQYESHNKQTGRTGPLIFKPPLTSFEPDALMDMDDAIALLDTSYKKHKNSFAFIKHGGFEEIFYANSEPEMNDWIGKLNYAATFRTAGVRLRGLLGTNYEGKNLLRKNSELSTLSNEVNASDSNSGPQGLDAQIAWEIMFYRRQLISEKISNLDDKLAVAQKELDQLLRNARHLVILLPIQVRTRESLVAAAVRMAAKLKWTRVEVWRNKTHRDVLIRDLEAEAATSFPPPPIITKATAEQPILTPRRPSQHTIQHMDGNSSSLALSPTLSTAVSDIPSSTNVQDHIMTTAASPFEQTTRSSSQIVLMTPSQKTNSKVAVGEVSPKANVQTESPLLHHQASIVSSHHSRLDDEVIIALQSGDGDDEERVLQEAGLVAVEGDVPTDSDKERIDILAGSPETPSVKEHKPSMRKSIQRTLREVPHPHRIPSNHHHHRKGRESSSSAGVTDERKDGDSAESQELKRGAGSFILHGKKASVITMSSEWSSIVAEDRIKRRPTPTEEETDLAGTNQSTLSIVSGDLETTPRQSKTSTALASPDKEAFHSAPSSRRGSVGSLHTDVDKTPVGKHN